MHKGRSHQESSIFLPLIKDVVSQWEFVWVLKSVLYHFRDRNYVIYRSVLWVLLGATSFQTRKYKSNHSHCTDTLSLVVYVQQVSKFRNSDKDASYYSWTGTRATRANNFELFRSKVFKKRFSSCWLVKLWVEQYCLKCEKCSYPIGYDLGFPSWSVRLWNHKTVLRKMWILLYIL